MSAANKGISEEFTSPFLQRFALYELGAASSSVLLMAKNCSEAFFIFIALQGLSIRD